MEASGVYTEPVYYALDEEDFTEILVVNPAHVKAVKGHKTDAKDCARIAELLECGLLQGSYIPPAELKELRDLTRYRSKTVQARTSEIQRQHKALESAGIKLGSVASDITGKGPSPMIDALIDGERRGAVMADLAQGRARRREMADLSMALEGRFTEHHALMGRLHRDAIRATTPRSPPWTGGPRTGPRRGSGRRACSRPFPGSATSSRRRGRRDRPRPHGRSARHEKLASWVTLAPGTTSAPASASTAGPATPGPTSSRCWCRPPGTRSGSGGGCRPATTGWCAGSAATRTPARRRRRSSRSRTTLLKIAYQVLKSGVPYQDLGADFYTRRESPERTQAWLERQLQRLHPDCTITITISPPEAALAPGA